MAFINYTHKKTVCLRNKSGNPEIFLTQTVLLSCFSSVKNENCQRDNSSNQIA